MDCDINTLGLWAFAMDIIAPRTELTVTN